MRTILLGVALLAVDVQAATPSVGVPLSVRRGFFTEADVGGFFTVGGDNAYSNLQTYLQLGVGGTFTVNDERGLIPLGFHVGIGANAQNCWSGLTSSGACSASDNFTVTFLSVSGAYLFRVAERLYLGPKLIVGLTLLDPEPIPEGNLAANLGAALALEYFTAMDHFSIGVDLSYRLIIGPNINAIAIYPRVQYTF